ncbi:MAG: type II secretion system GspH family protein [Betaproteobacteria bacterium]|nr:type II secretion system GspH family protein [Betaproteobacteria bacterium]MDH3435603.1 type II secretion system GspH family protein [Betaproteobacteria bacterium]
MRRPRRIPRGFTIIELAVTMVVIAILLGSILVPLNTQVESRKYDETQRVLERAREALLGFAAANGRFPCPASATSNGAEHVVSVALGTCDPTVSAPPVNAGFLPAATLGLAPVDGQGYAVDAWGLTPYNRIRYAVSSQTVNGVANPFTALPNPPTNTTGMRAAGMANISGAALLHVCSSGASPPVVAGSVCSVPANVNTLTTNAVVVIWSVGPNAATTGGLSTDEAENPNPVGGSNDRIFVSKTRSGGTAGEFDDSVTWISSATVFNRLIQAGQLP